MKRKKIDYSLEAFDSSIALYYNGWRKQGIGYVNHNFIRRNAEWVHAIKVFIPKAWGIGNPQKDWLKPFIPTKDSCCTETYLLVGPFKDTKMAENAISYIQTKFFHLLVSVVKNTQNTMQSEYQYIPLQDFTELWTDEKLYAKYNLSAEEISFIEKMIKPME